MQKVILLLFFALSNLVSFGQCSMVSVQISSSDTTHIQLYQAGFFLIPSGFNNICDWKVTSFSDKIIHQETTSGGFPEQSFVSFSHSIPITDSMKVTLLITNNMEGITCTMNDTLFWKETEIIPGVIIGNWEVLSSNGGVEEEITSSTGINIDIQNITLFPSPVHDYFQIKGTQDIYAFAILDLHGQLLESYYNIHKGQKVDFSNYASGIYFVQFWDKNYRNTGIKKIIKM